MLQACLPAMAKMAGYEVRFSRPLVVMKDGKVEFSYTPETVLVDPAEAKRVVGLWRKWWKENREAVLKEIQKEPDAANW